MCVGGGGEGCLLNPMVIVSLTLLQDRFSPTLPSLQAIRGNAIDRHLLGLKLQAIEDLVSIPELFMDTAYAVAMHFNLSTSQVGLIRAKVEVDYIHYHCISSTHFSLIPLWYFKPATGPSKAADLICSCQPFSTL